MKDIYSLLIRTGERGEGKWRKASWDEALDYVVDKLKRVIQTHGTQEAAFTLHGFGHEAKLATRCCGKGLSDSVLQENIMDRVGGSPALHGTFVTVKLA